MALQQLNPLSPLFNSLVFLKNWMYDAKLLNTVDLKFRLLVLEISQWGARVRLHSLFGS